MNEEIKMNPRGLKKWLSERGLRARLMMATLLVIVPVIVLAVTMLGKMSASLLRSSADHDLVQATDSAADSIDQWDRYFVMALQNVQTSPDIASMNPDRQQQAITRMKKVYDRIDILRTTDPDGYSHVRSDGKSPINYSDRAWFKACMGGASIYREVLITRTTRQPALNISTPIHDRTTGKVVGVLSAVTKLASLPSVVESVMKDFSCVTLVVDEHGRALIHSDVQTARTLYDLSDYPPVHKALTGKPGELDFTDAEGRQWLSRSVQLHNGWFLVTEMEQAKAMAAGVAVMRRAYELMAAAVVVLTLLTWLIATHLLKPIHELTTAATKLARGQWDQRVPERGTDEIGRLAQTFNMMADELEQGYRRIEDEVKDRTRRLEAVSQELVATARQAGMAEIATGVLHNVGNVLNSVNISVNLLGERINRLPLADLAAATEMMQSHRDDLGTFLTNDEKGRLLPEYLSMAAKLLGEENEALLTDLSDLTHGIDHIKQVVKLQQNYAKSSTFRELASPASLIEDALRMNLLSLERHQIQVVRQIEEVESVTIDKHKVLQVLVNLISNAKNALMAAPGGGPHKMEIRLKKVELPAGTFVRFQVADNGAGIAPENLSRIFNHGFTTRKEGHGFGLHSAANAIREMGGSLTAHSDGIGKGAVFTLDVLLKAVEVHA